MTAKGTRRGPATWEQREKMSAWQLGQPKPYVRAERHGHWKGGRWINGQGFVQLSSCYGHPLASEDGGILEHRKIVYDAIGPGPHPCHFQNSRADHNGQLLEWGGTRGIIVAHLDFDKQNNDRDNLVVSCWWCEKNRRKSNPIDAVALDESIVDYVAKHSDEATGPTRMELQQHFKMTTSAFNKHLYRLCRQGRIISPGAGRGLIGYRISTVNEVGGRNV